MSRLFTICLHVVLVNSAPHGVSQECKEAFDAPAFSQEKRQEQDLRDCLNDGQNVTVTEKADPGFSWTNVGRPWTQTKADCLIEKAKTRCTSGTTWCFVALDVASGKAVNLAQCLPKDVCTAEDNKVYLPGMPIGKKAGFYSRKVDTVKCGCVITLETTWLIVGIAIATLCVATVAMICFVCWRKQATEKERAKEDENRKQ